VAGKRAHPIHFAPRYRKPQKCSAMARTSRKPFVQRTQVSDGRFAIDHDQPASRFELDTL
jgi:hypothetical protein